MVQCQGHKSKIVGQGGRVKVKGVGGFVPHGLPGGVTSGHVLFFGG